jgi:hypothetical protein
VVSRSQPSLIKPYIGASPGSVKPGTHFPLAITKAVADQAGSYNSSTKTIKIGSSYHYGTSEAGQWTSFQVDSSNVPDIMDLMTDGNPTALNVGDDIWIQPGTKNTIYSSVPVGMDVLVPIVQNIDTHAYIPIIGFICFHITASVGGSGKYIEGYFTNFYAGLSGPMGPNYGAKTPPKAC